MLAETILDSDEGFNERREILTKRMKYINCLLTHFWKSFIREYLRSLREHHNLKLKGGIQENIKQGATVYVCEENEPRGNWKMGKVEYVMEGRDVQIRNDNKGYYQREANISKSSIDTFLSIRGL